MTVILLAGLVGGVIGVLAEARFDLSFKVKQWFERFRQWSKFQQ